MPQHHAREKALASIKDLYGVKHADVIALLDSPDCEDLCDVLDSYADISVCLASLVVVSEGRDAGGYGFC